MNDEEREAFTRYVENFLREQEMISRLKENDKKMRASADPYAVRDAGEQLVVDLMKYLAGECEPLDPHFVALLLPPVCPVRFWMHYCEAGA
ncbi:MAG TPA: hypothetical protein VJ464_16825 [Blastocatellia bacterium]|nr:hypothetical protein [Blastocatellia bacterium]